MAEAEATIKTRMTAAEFAQLPETMMPTELIDGELIVSPSRTNTHQRALGDTFFFLRSLGKNILPHIRVVLSPSDLYFDNLNAVQPDIFVVAGKDSKCRLGEDGY